MRDAAAYAQRKNAATRIGDWMVRVAWVILLAAMFGIAIKNRGKWWGN